MNHDNYDKNILKQLTRIADSLEKIVRNESDWKDSLSDIDLDCVEQWEKLLDKTIRSKEEYCFYDNQINEMVLEITSYDQLTAYYPDFDDMYYKEKDDE